jgi:hypothetical protein
MQPAGPNPGLPSDAFTAARIAARLQFLKDSLIGDISKTLWVLMGTVVIRVGIACAERHVHTQYAANPSISPVISETLD